MKTLSFEQMQNVNGSMSSSCAWGLAGTLVLWGSALACMSNPFTWWAAAEFTFAAASSMAGVMDCAR